MYERLRHTAHHLRLVQQKQQKASDVWADGPGAPIIAKLHDDVWLRTASGSCWLYPAAVQRVRLRLYILLEVPESGLLAKVLTCAVFTGIVVAIVALVLESEPSLSGPEHMPMWAAIEAACTVFFSAEYVSRLLVCDILRTETYWSFFRTGSNLCDLVAIMPFFLEKVLGPNGKVLRVLRAFRLTRLVRIFRLGRYFAGMRVMIDALVSSSQALYVLAFLCLVGMLLFSSIIFYVEKMSCPDALLAHPPEMTDEEFSRYSAECEASIDGFHPGNQTHPSLGLCCDRRGTPLFFPSICATFWWSIVTMTTVGFGDTFPRTDQGRLVAWITMLCGILVIALPVAIVGSRFQDVYEEYETEKIENEIRLCRGSEQREELEREALLCEKIKDAAALRCLVRRTNKRLAQLKREARDGHEPNVGGSDLALAQRLVKKLAEAEALEPLVADRCARLRGLLEKSLSHSAKIRSLEQREQQLHVTVERDFQAVAEILDEAEFRFFKRGGQEAPASPSREPRPPGDDSPRSDPGRVEDTPPAKPAWERTHTSPGP